MHCARGINRSGAICVAHLMLENRWDLVQAVQHVKTLRGNTLTNRGFHKQLIAFARKHHLLYPADETTV